MDYGDITRLLELEKRLRNIDLVFGHPIAVAHADLYEKVQNSLPSTVEEAIAFTRGVEAYWENKFKDQIGSLEADIADAEKRLKEMAKLIRPYLPEDS